MKNWSFVPVNKDFGFEIGSEIFNQDLDDVIFSILNDRITDRVTLDLTAWYQIGETELMINVRIGILEQEPDHGLQNIEFYLWEIFTQIQIRKFTKNQSPSNQIT